MSTQHIEVGFQNVIEHIENSKELDDLIQILCRGKIKFMALDQNLFFSKMSDREIEGAAEKFKSAGITIESLHAPYGKENDLSACEEGKRQASVLKHLTVMKRLKIFGAEKMVIHASDIINNEEENQPHLDNSLKSIEELLLSAEKLGIKLCLENMPPSYLCHRVEELKQIIEKFSSPYLGVCFDTGHANINHELKEQLEPIKNSIFTLHVHDNDGTRDLHLQPPYGTIDWEEFIQLFENLPYHLPFIVEATPWGGATMDWGKKEVESLLAGEVLTRNHPWKSYLKCAKCGHFVFGTENKPFCYCKRKLV